MSEQQSVPITVFVPERHNIELLQQFSADPSVMILASGETLAGAGLLGMLRVGRALVIAPDVASRTPGCECCQVRLDLVDAIRAAVLRRTRPNRLIVVVDRAEVAPDGEIVDEDPASDVVTAISTLHADSEIARLAHLGGLVVDVDACAASTRLASGIALWDPQIEAAIAIADTVAVSGADFLIEQARSAIVHSLSTLNRIGRVKLSTATALEAARLVDLDAWTRSPPPSCSGVPAGAESCAWPATSSPHGEETVETVVLHRCGVLDPDAANEWLDRVVAESPRGLLRFQASLRVSTHSSRVCIRGSRSAMRSADETPRGRGWLTSGRGDRENVVVLIGRDLDPHSLSESFESIDAAP